MNTTSNLLFSLLLVVSTSTHAGEAEAIQAYQDAMANARTSTQNSNQSWTQEVPLRAIIQGGALAYSAKHTLETTKDNPYAYGPLIGAAASMGPTDPKRTMSGIFGW